ncbi:hypothetical protein PUR71_37635 [Streptomyces sp. SP17BM10]|nr:hypothetical protein [Streptomyces sp. SP17BM10]MEE1788583.1 hypothetical protein [Streptomyces sp. SP17BM10]
MQRRHGFDDRCADGGGKPVDRLTVSAAGFTVGSLQPVNQGVVFTS